MRLPVAFVRLPFAVDTDELTREIDALDPSAWKDHPEGAVGNTAVPLVAANGDPGDDAVAGPMLPTPHLAALPYTRRVMGALDSVIGRSRLMRIPEEGDLYEHVDVAYYWRDHLRVHVPVVTDPSVQFMCGAESVHMGAGEVWIFDTWRRHKVVNPAKFPRTHLVIDTVGSARLWSAIEQSNRPPIAVATDGPEPTIITELVNRPTVISPWELNQAYGALLRDVAQSEPDAVEPLRAAFEPVRHAWRNAWARFGDRPEGLATFTMLKHEATAAIRAAGGGARLPNGTQFLEAVHHHVLVVTEPASTAPRPAPAVSAARPTAGSAPPRITRPVFIVSSPRSGSSLLFETLAKSPDLFTIGGESHQVIESVPGLRPIDRDWESNRLEAADATVPRVDALRDRFVARLHDRDGNPARGPVRMLEKTPKNALRVPFLQAAFPDAAFIYLYRDPRETVSSMLDAWRSGRFTMYPDLPGWTGTPWSLLLVPGWRDLIGRPLGEVVSRQWATATTILLDDLEALDPDRWCVASYDQLLGDPQGEMERLAEFCGVGWDTELTEALPLSRHTLDSPHPDKWMRNAEELEPYWDEVAEVAVRAHGVFASPPRTEPVARERVDIAAAAAPTPSAPTPVAPTSANESSDDAVDPEAAFASGYTSAFPQVLEALGSSLMVTTYQSGRLIVVRSHGGVLNTHLRAFPSPMGIARNGQTLSLGTKAQVLVFQNQPAVIARLEDAERHDACFMPRRAHTTGDIRIHDLGYAGDELWVVNTRFSCLATLDDQFSFVPRWRPPFVTALAPEDRCHLNGLCVIDDEPRFVTALGDSNDVDGWRDHKVDGGVLIDIPSGEFVTRGMCMPHSPRWHDGRLWLLESGRGVLVTVDLDTGERTDVAAVPGFARGLSLVGPFAFIGLSQVREHVFDGLPLTGEGVDRNCGVWIVDVRNGNAVAWLKFEGTVQEIYEVLALPGTRYPEIVEPMADLVDAGFVLPDSALADVPAELRS
jgi:uncharacterized protein (TIGR03032 family)